MADKSDATTEAEPHVHGPDCDHDHDHDHGHDHEHHHHGPAPIPIEARLLTEEGRKRVEEETRKPVVDLPYEVAEETEGSGCLKTLKLRVPAETAEREIGKYYEAVRKEIVLPGFRKGKAPVKLIRIRLGEDGEREAMGEIAVNVLRQENIKRKFELAADPKIVGFEREGSDAPLTIAFELETHPKVELTTYTGFTVEVPVRPFDEKAVDHELEGMRLEWATWENVAAERGLDTGLAVVLDVRVTGEDGQELSHLSREGWLLRNFESQTPEPLAAALKGAKAGDVVSAKVENERTTRKGETIKTTDTYEATVKSIKERKLPDLDDEFAKDQGPYDSLDELRAAIRSRMEKAEADRRRGTTLFKLVEKIAESNPFDVPPTSLRSIQADQIYRDSEEMKRYGLKLSQVVGDAEQYLEGRRKFAEFMLKRAYILSKIAEIEKLEVGEAEIEAEIGRLAEEAGRKALAIRAELEAERKLGDLIEGLKSRRIADFLVERNTIVEVEEKPEEVGPPTPEGESGGNDE